MLFWEDLALLRNVITARRRGSDATIDALACVRSDGVVFLERWSFSVFSWRRRRPGKRSQSAGWDLSDGDVTGVVAVE